MESGHKFMLNDILRNGKVKRANRNVLYFLLTDRLTILPWDG